MLRIPTFAPRHIKTPTGESLGVEIRAHGFPFSKARRSERRTSLKLDGITKTVSEASEFDRNSYREGLAERFSAIPSLQGIQIAYDQEEQLVALTFKSDVLRDAIKSATSWSGVGNLQFTPGGFRDANFGRQQTDRQTRELAGLQARVQTFGPDWDKPEIKRDDFFAAIRNLIGDADGVYAVMGPSADFTGVQNNDKPGAGEIGVLTLIRKQGKRYTIYDGSVLTTAVKDGDKWSTTSTTLRQREHNDIFAISEPFDKAIIANLGVLKLDGGQDKETAPIVVKATIPAGKTVELKDLAQAVTGDDSDIRLPRGSMFVMARSDGVVDFSVKRNVICAMPSELGDKWVDDFKDAGKGYTAWQEEFAVPGDKTYIGAGTFDTDLPYSRNGHVHGVNAESGGHLVSITAGNSPVEVAIVMYPARKSAYTSTTGQRVN